MISTRKAVNEMAGESPAALCWLMLMSAEH